MTKQPTRIDTGFNSPREHFESRVMPAYAEFLRLKNRANAVNASVAMWEMRDHLRTEAMPGADRRESRVKQFNADLIRRCPEFEFVQDIAEATKHADLNRSGVKVARISGTGSIGGKMFTVTALGTSESVPDCTLQIDLKDGTTRSLEDVLRIVAIFLRAELAPPESG